MQVLVVCMTADRGIRKHDSYNACQVEYNASRKAVLS